VRRSSASDHDLLMPSGIGHGPSRTLIFFCVSPKELDWCVPDREYSVDVLLEKLDSRFREWKPETVNDVRQRVADIIDLADQDALDLLRSRELEHSVLDLLDEPASR
jgi:hypothetical protein